MVRHFLLSCVTVAALALTTASGASAALITLYDDGINSLPGDQPWVGYFALGGLANQAVIAQGTQLTTDAAAGAGYSNHTPLSNPLSQQTVNSSFPVLERNVGFSLSFQLQIFDESHVSDDRAGFSVIALGDDGRGIELGFWEDRVFAQTDTPMFTHGEEVVFDTTAAEVSYVLTVQQNDYSLAADTQTILSGTLRDYSTFMGTPLGVPYTLDNYLFMGDNTSRAAADVAIGTVILNTSLTAVPEPSTFAASTLAVASCVIRRRRRVYSAKSHRTL